MKKLARVCIQYVVELWSYKKVWVKIFEEIRESLEVNIEMVLKTAL